MFQKTSQIRLGRVFSNQIKFRVLIYYKFNGIGLRFLFITSVFPPTKFSDQDRGDLFNIKLSIIHYSLYSLYTNVVCNVDQNSSLVFY